MVCSESAGICRLHARWHVFASISDLGKGERKQKVSNNLVLKQELGNFQKVEAVSERRK